MCLYKDLYVIIHSNFIHNHQHKCPSKGELTTKLWYIHIIEYYSAANRNKQLICATTQMTLKRFSWDHTRWSQLYRLLENHDRKLICGVSWDGQWHGLQRSMRKLLGMMDVFITLFMVWFLGCHNKISGQTEIEMDFLTSLVKVTMT